jgi:uncharacterized protein (TIGR04141 family)
LSPELRGHSLLYIKQYREYLEERGVSESSFSLAALSKHRLQLLDADDVSKKSYSIYKSLIFEVEEPDDHYAFHLSDGVWYRVASGLIQELQQYLDRRLSPPSLPEYNHKTEGEYNESIAEQIGGVCLDKTNISPRGSTAVEPCDLLRLSDGRAQLIHVKIGTSSDRLSHHFNQGTNAITLLKEEPEAIDRLSSLVEERSHGTDMSAAVEAIRAGSMSVLFGVATHKVNPDSSSLPLFSRISLRRQIRAIELMGFEARYEFIHDKTDRAGKEKTRKPRKVLT